MKHLPLSEFFEYVRTELNVADKTARATYSSVIESKGPNRTKEQEKADSLEAFNAAREVQLLAHKRLYDMLKDKYLPTEESHGNQD